MKIISLTKVKPNHRGKVAQISGGINMQNKLMHLGIFKGKELLKLSHIGLRGPVVVKAGRTILAIGHTVAEKIFVEQE